MGWLLLLFGMEFPGLVALTDCYQRPAERFAGGERDRAAWLKWLVVALFLMPIGVGYGILLGYHWNVIKRNTMAVPVSEDTMSEPKANESRKPREDTHGAPPEGGAVSE